MLHKWIELLKWTLCLYLMYVSTWMTNKHIKDTKFKCYQRDANEHYYTAQKKAFQEIAKW